MVWAWFVASVGNRQNALIINKKKTFSKALYFVLISYFIEHTLNRDTSDCVMVELIFSYLLLRLVVVRAMYDICVTKL